MKNLQELVVNFQGKAYLRGERAIVDEV